MTFFDFNPQQVCYILNDSCSSDFECMPKNDKGHLILQCDARDMLEQIKPVKSYSGPSLCSSVQHGDVYYGNGPMFQDEQYVTFARWRKTEHDFIRFVIYNGEFAAKIAALTGLPAFEGNSGADNIRDNFGHISPLMGKYDGLLRFLNTL